MALRMTMGIPRGSHIVMATYVEGGQWETGWDGLRGPAIGEYYGVMVAGVGRDYRYKDSELVVTV
jgi:hypothetical protein